MTTRNTIVLHDQHMHSYYSKDSKEPLESYFIEATKQNISYVITCEHYDFFTATDHTTWAADFDALIEEQKTLRIKYPNITPLLGLEVGFREDHLDKMVTIANKYPFDLIQLSLHDDGKLDYYFKESFEDDPIKGLNRYYAIMSRGMDLFENYDVISHIDYGFRTAKLACESLDIMMFEESLKDIMNKIITRNKSLEINTKIQGRLDDKHTRSILYLYKSLGGKSVTLSSDAHFISRYREGFDHYLQIIKECGFDYVIYYINRKPYKYYID